MKSEAQRVAGQAFSNYEVAYYIKSGNKYCFRVSKFDIFHLFIVLSIFVLTCVCVYYRFVLILVLLMSQGSIPLVRYQK